MSIVGNLTSEERAMVRALNDDRKIERAAIEGKPFHLAGPGTTEALRALQFPQAMVYGLIEAGLLYVTQRAYAFEDLSWPTGRPFSCRLTREGLTARATILAETPRQQWRLAA